MAWKYPWALVPIAAVGGCFNPDGGAVDTDATDASTSSTTTVGTSGPTTSSTTSTTSSTTGSTSSDASTSTTDTGSTSAGAGVPEVDLTVQGSTTPAAFEHSGYVQLAATVVDDGTVVRVDFYDGETLVATDEEAPYEAQVLMTSVDEGTHGFQARATDDTDLEGVSETIDLEVTIVGGAVDVDASGIFQLGGLAFQPGGGTVIDGEGNVILVAPVTNESAGAFATGLISYAPDLDVINWQRTDPVTLSDTAGLLALGPPALNLAGTEVMIGGVEIGNGDLQETSNMYRYPVVGTAPLTPVTVNHTSDTGTYGHAGIAVAPSGHVYMPGPDGDVSRFGPNNGVLTWESPAGPPFNVSDLGMYRMTTDSAGALISDSMVCNFDDGGLCSYTTQKLRGFDGVEQWTASVSLGGNDLYILVGQSAVLSDDSVVSIFPNTVEDEFGLRFVVRDSDGDEQLQTNILTGTQYGVSALAQGPGGDIIVAGFRVDEALQVGWVARIALDGTLIWENTLDYGVSNDMALALTLTDDGQAYVMGGADLDAFIVFVADLWLARIDL